MTRKVVRATLHCQLWLSEGLWASSWGSSTFHQLLRKSWCHTTRTVQFKGSLLQKSPTGFQRCLCMTVSGNRIKLVLETLTQVGKKNITEVSGSACADTSQALQKAKFCTALITGSDRWACGFCSASWIHHFVHSPAGHYQQHCGLKHKPEGIILFFYYLWQWLTVMTDFLF